ncbi:MAG: hypothetical protein FWF09_04305 [Bacteroidales bacterium]|nr:hypothetical protein [Bacteroidales bacterium]
MKNHTISCLRAFVFSETARRVRPQDRKTVRGFVSSLQDLVGTGVIFAVGYADASPTVNRVSPLRGYSCLRAFAPSCLRAFAPFPSPHHSHK